MRYLVRFLYIHRMLKCSCNAECHCRARTERLQQEHGAEIRSLRADIERLQQANRSLRADKRGLQEASRADTERLHQTHEAEITSMIENTSAELEQARDSIIGSLQEQLDHLKKSHTAQVILPQIFSTYSIASVIKFAS